jgi:hypothetical protein
MQDQHHCRHKHRELRRRMDTVEPLAHRLFTKPHIREEDRQHPSPRPDKARRPSGNHRCQHHHDRKTKAPTGSTLRRLERTQTRPPQRPAPASQLPAHHQAPAGQQRQRGTSASTAVTSELMVPSRRSSGRAKTQNRPMAEREAQPAMATATPSAILLRRYESKSWRRLAGTQRSKGSRGPLRHVSLGSCRQRACRPNQAPSKRSVQAARGRCPPPRSRRRGMRSD